MTTTPLDSERLAEIDRLAGHELAETRVPGMAIAVTGPEGPAEIRTYGFANIEAGFAVAPDTLFEIGSIGKTATAIAVLQLAEERRLDLHAPVAEVLPWFEMPVVGRPVTIHDLLSHTAGITSGIDGTPEAASQVFALRGRRPGTAPGERFHYSNLGFKVLGLVVAAVEGASYPDVIRRRVLEPLGMTATEPAITNEMRALLAVGYGYAADDRIGYPGSPLAPATWLETGTADGSIASTAGDMAVFARMLMRQGEGPSGRLLTEASFARLTGPHIWPSPDFGYGYGLMTRVLDGRTFIGHSGGMVGFVAGVQVDPAAELAVVVLQNGTMGRPMLLARRLLGVVPAPHDAGAPDVAGTYQADAAAAGLPALDFSAGPDGPRVHLHDRSIALEALGGGRFLAPDADLDRYALQFEPAHARPIVVWHGPDRYIRAGAAAPVLATPDPLVAALVGHYRSHNPWTTNFRVILRGDVPWLVFAAPPDGFQDEQPLVARADGTFGVSDDPGNPEDVVFDTVLDGRPVRAWLGGTAYYRVR